jgi:hypothetical protein
VTSPADSSVCYLTAADPETGAEETLALRFVLTNDRVYVSPAPNGSLEWLAGAQRDRHVVVRIGDPNAAPRPGVVRLVQNNDPSVRDEMVNKYGPDAGGVEPTIIAVELGGPGEM